MRVKQSILSACVALIASAPALSQSIPLVELHPIRVTGATAAGVAEQRLPSITQVGMSIGSTSTGGLTSTSTGLEKLGIDLGAGQTVETYAGIVTTKTTLFEPASNKWKTKTAEDYRNNNNETDPYICGAGTVHGAPTVGGTQTRSDSTPRTFTGNAANPSFDHVVGAGTMFERNPYVTARQAGGGTGTPLQAIPLPGRDHYGNLAAGTSFPTCGTP